ncbi:hypothetical protein [Fusibacter ferrireducens]|uniref:Uncharacterized protein n=1 Tax=Fusibacter ferrireducens TaxID=2785058 RepID=A0ABR9ZP34_9FIRM|nr:hypothetical protein [Fusibacter ferrireducens]MBF4692228.1 hypothetical protein [Fusibacter ferrireducens]
MEKTVLASQDVAHDGFVVFYEDRLIAVKITDGFVKDTNRSLKKKFKAENPGFLANLMYTDDMEYWEAFPNSFLNMEPAEIQERFPDITLIKYVDIDKFKLSGSYSTYDEGVQINCPGTLLIKGNGEKITIDHNYKDNDPIYKKVAALKAQWIETL